MTYCIYTRDGRLVAQGIPTRSAATIQAERFGLVDYKLLTSREAHYHR